MSNVSEPTTEKEKPKNPDKLGQKRKKRPLVIRQIPSSIPALSSQPIPPAAPKSTPPPIVPSPVAPRGEETPKSAPHESQSHESQLGDEELRERLIDSLLKDQTGGAEKERH